MRKILESSWNILIKLIELYMMTKYVCCLWKDCVQLHSFVLKVHSLAWNTVKKVSLASAEGGSYIRLHTPEIEHTNPCPHKQGSRGKRVGQLSNEHWFSVRKCSTQSQGTRDVWINNTEFSTCIAIYSSRKSSSNTQVSWTRTKLYLTAMTCIALQWSGWSLLIFDIASGRTLAYTFKNMQKQIRKVNRVEVFRLRPGEQTFCWQIYDSSADITFFLNAWLEYLR